MAKFFWGNFFSFIDFETVSKVLNNILGNNKIKQHFFKIKTKKLTMAEGSNNEKPMAKVEDLEEAQTKKIVHTYPTSSKKGPKNWDAIEREVMKEEEEEQLEGDAAVNKMFQKIYRDSPDDVKKAMMKSYSESGGTCLSTDWKEVSKKTQKVQPPSGMEFKKWN